MSTASTLAERCRRADRLYEKRLRLAVASALATPARICGVRDCRRKRNCQYHDNKVNLPVCIRDAPETLRTVYDSLLALLLRFEKAIVPGELAYWHGRFSPDPDERERQLTCIAILHTALPSRDPLHAEFRAFWSRERALEAMRVEDRKGDGAGTAAP